VKSDPATLTDIQRAGRFYYLQKNSFGGLILRPKFHYGVTHASNYNPERIPEVIEQAHQRLQRVQVESLPYEQILEKYDRSTTCFYLDPPYWGPKLYKFNFAGADFAALADRLSRLKGKFILSLNDRREVRETFAAFQITACQIAYTAKQNTSARFREVLICNFRPKESDPVDAESLMPLPKSANTAHPNRGGP
jgi:DNA adenine methylase